MLQDTVLALRNMQRPLRQVSIIKSQYYFKVGISFKSEYYLKFSVKKVRIIGVKNVSIIKSQYHFSRNIILIISIKMLVLFNKLVLFDCQFYQFISFVSFVIYKGVLNFFSQYYFIRLVLFFIVSILALQRSIKSTLARNIKV